MSRGWIVLEGLGGLGVFLLGMRLLGRHLTDAAGGALSHRLVRASRNRLSGAAMGSVLGFTIQSGPASVLLVGLTHAGLLGLRQAAPVVFGFNVGTTLAMQVLAFQVATLWALPLLGGLVLTVGARTDRGTALGMALAGFGLLLLGLGRLSASLGGLREPLLPWVARIGGTTWGATLLGIVVGAAVTGALFSSAATLGMALALAESGVFTELRQAYPLVLGAQLGTCLTSLLAAGGANAAGRRTAALHVGFNLVNVLLGVVLLPWLPGWIERTAPGNPVRQIANLHTALRSLTAVLLLPWADSAVVVVRRFCARSTRIAPEPERSRLEAGALPRPEQALACARQECRRLSRIARDSLRTAAALLERWSGEGMARIQADENAMDRLKLAFQAYVNHISLRHLSHRQALHVTAFNRSVLAIERIQDHIEHLGRLAGRARPAFLERFPAGDQDGVRRLLERTGETLEAVAASFDPAPEEPGESSRLQDLRDRVEAFRRCHEALWERFDARLWRKGRGLTPAQGLLLDKVLHDLEQIAQHADQIAHAQARSGFYVKASKIDRVAPPLSAPWPTEG